MDIKKSLETIFIQKHFSVIEMFFLMFTIVGVIYKDDIQAIICGIGYFLTMYLLDRKDKVDKGEL